MSKKITATVYDNVGIGNLRSPVLAHWSGSDGSIIHFDDNLTYTGADIHKLLGRNENSHFIGKAFTGVYGSSEEAEAAEVTYQFKLVESNMLRVLLPKADILNVDYRPYGASFRIDMTNVFGQFPNVSYSEPWVFPHQGILLIRLSRDLFLYATTQSITNDDQHFIMDVNVAEPPDKAFDSTTHHRGRLEYSFGPGSDTYDLSGQTLLSDLRDCIVTSDRELFHVLDNATSDFLGVPIPFGNFNILPEEFEPYLLTIADEIRHELRSDEDTATAISDAGNNDFYVPLDDWLNVDDPISEFIVYREKPNDTMRIKFHAEAAITGVMGTLSNTLNTRDEKLENHQQEPLFMSIAEIPISEHYSYFAIIHPTIQTVFNVEEPLPAYLLEDTKHIPFRYNMAINQRDVRVASVVKDAGTKLYKLKSKLAYFITPDSQDTRPRNRSVGQYNIWNEGANLLPADTQRAVPLSEPQTTRKKNK